MAFSVTISVDGDNKGGDVSVTIFSVVSVTLSVVVGFCVVVDVVTVVGLDCDVVTVVDVVVTGFSSVTDVVFI